MTEQACSASAVKYSFVLPGGLQASGQSICLASLSAPYQDGVPLDSIEHCFLQSQHAEVFEVEQMVEAVSASVAAIIGLIDNFPSILSPGILKYGSMAFKFSEKSQVVVPGYVLDRGFDDSPSDLQAVVERDGYELFNGASLSPSSEGSCLRVSTRPAALFSSRTSLVKVLEECSGVLSFQALMLKILEVSPGRLFQLAGEGVFALQKSQQHLSDEKSSIYRRSPVLLGKIVRQAQTHVWDSARRASIKSQQAESGELK